MSDPSRDPFPTPPPPEALTRAMNDAKVGRSLTLYWTHRGMTIPLLVTAAWEKTWRQLALTTQDRADIRTACIHIARGRLHPALGAQPAPGYETEVLMACPHAGWTLTWMTHPTRRCPIFLTLSRAE